MTQASQHTAPSTASAASPTMSTTVADSPTDRDPANGIGAPTATNPGAATAQPRRTQRATTLGRELLAPVLVLLGARVVMFAVAGGVAARIAPTSAWNLTQWDSSWYLRAASDGWPHFIPTTNGVPVPSTLAFFPAYPTAVRAAHFVLPFLGWSGAAFLTTLMCEVAMVVAVYLLGRDIWNRDVALRGVTLLVFFPGAYVFAMYYSEPLLIAAAAASLLALRRHHWLWAGVFAALTTSARPNGIAIIAACAWAAFVAIKQHREWRSLIAVALAPAGIAVWFLYLWQTTGNKIAWFRAEQGWGEHIKPLAVVDLFHAFVDDPRHWENANVTVPLFGVVATVVLLLLLWRSGAPGTLIVFASVVVLLSVMSMTLGLRPRFVMTAFPLVMGLAYWVRGAAMQVTVAISATLMSAFLVLTITGIQMTP